MIVVAILVGVIIVILGLVAIRGHRSKAPDSPPQNTPAVTRADMVRDTTAPRSSSINDPGVVELNQMTTASDTSRGNGNRDEYIRMTTGS